MRTSLVLISSIGLFFSASTAAAGEIGNAGATGAGSLETAKASETSEASEITATPAATSAATSDPLPPPASVCSAVNCSGHGTCIEQTPKPTCACNDGYAPDSTDGLSCLPYTQTPSVAAAPSPSVQDLEREAALRQFHSVLPNYRAERDYERYTRIKDYAKYSGSFPDYMAERFRKQMAGGIAMVAIGGVLTIAAIVFLVIGTNSDAPIMHCGDEYQDAGDYSCDNRTTLFLVFGNVFAVTSITLFAVGAPKLVRGSERLEKVNRIRNAKPNAGSRIGNFYLSFVRSDRLGSHGLIAGFDF